MSGAPGVIGRGIRIKGELTGAGDLVIEGAVEGHIHLESHLSIAETGVVEASIAVERLTVFGRAIGDIDATGRVEVKATAHVEGDIRAGSVIIEEGAEFRGTIAMTSASDNASRSRPGERRSRDGQHTN